MNRKSFLSCQPFLYQLSPCCVRHDESGPSSQLRPSRGAENFSQEIILSNVSLSIEPVENSIVNNNCIDSNVFIAKETVGPAYFSHSKTTKESTKSDSAKGHQSDISFAGTGDETGEKKIGTSCDSGTADPALCMTDLTLYTAKLPEKGMTTPVKKLNRRNLSEIDHWVVTKDEAVLIANIDGDDFQFDLNQLLNMKVGKEENYSPSQRDCSTGKAKANTTKPNPAFLLLEFPSCCFRLFSPNSLTDSPLDDETVIGTGDSLEETNRDTVEFDGVYEKLKSVLSTDCLFPFPLSYSGMITSSIELSELAETNTIQPLSHARRCLHSYTQSWNDLAVFEETIQNPMLAVQYIKSSDGSAEKRNFKDIMTALMEEIPKNVSSSFIEKEKWILALGSYNHQLSVKMQAFDNLIDDFLMDNPETNRKTKRMRYSKEDDDHTGFERLTNDNCVGRYEEILKAHKSSMISKHEMNLLPLKGQFIDSPGVSGI